MSKQRLFEEIALENGIFETRVTKKFSLRKPYVRQNPGVVKAVIPGVVSDIVANVGTAVNQGDTILILEAMKMLNRIVAPLHGTIKAVHVSRGEKVAKGKVLMEIDSNGLLIKENRQGSRKS